jgi:hypothetical protein
MANLILNGSTSGSVTLSSPAVSGTTTLTLPTTTGTIALTAAPTFTGQATIPTINLTGGQITFPATAVPSADANTLDDYEEGTWTTAVSDGTASVTGATSYYVKVGKIVTCSISFYNKNISGLSASGLRITGLPFTNNGTYECVSMIYGATGANAAVGAFISGSNSYAFLYFGSSGENASSLTKASFNSATNASIWGTIIYQTT